MLESQKAEPRRVDDFIPPCVVEARLRTPPSITYYNAGDGDVYVSCPGNGNDCLGGKVKVDRHDLVQPRLPLITEAIGEICSSQKMFHREKGSLLLREICVDHSR